MTPNNRVIRSIPQLLRPDGRVAKAVATAVDTELRTATRAQFDTEGAEGGDPWAPLSPPYKAWKDRQFGKAIDFNTRLAAARGRRLTGAALTKALGAQNKILQFTGDMKRAFTKREDPAHVAEGQVVAETKVRVLFGAQGPVHWGYHQQGAAPLPRRPILAFNAGAVLRAREAALKAMLPYVMQRVKALARLQPGR